MKKRLFSLILALVFIITAIPMNFSAAQEYPVEGVTKELIYFRQSPRNAITPGVVGCETINKGEKVTVLCESDGFYLLKYNGYYGFARMKDIQIGTAAQSTPVPTKTPTPQKTAAPTQQNGLRFYSDVYSGVTKEKIYFRVNPTSATTPRVSGCETIASDKEIYVLGLNGDFYYISYKGYYGYARTQDIRVYGKARTTPMPTVTNASTPKPTASVPSAPTTGGDGESSSLQYYGDKYRGQTREKVYFRVNPSSATTPRVSGCESIASGKEVVVLGINGDFYYITYNGYYGYARVQDIKILGKVNAQSTPTPTPFQPAMYADKYVGATLEKVYFRAKPTSATTPRVSGCETIASGKEIIVLGEYGDFYYITYNGYNGYARKQDVRIFGKYVPPTPTPMPTANPTSAPIPRNISLTGEQTQKWNKVASNLIAQSAKNRDTKGWIYIPTTNNINYPIMYDSKFYYNDHTPERKSSVRGSIYLYNEFLNNINVIAGHNSRESKTMFHELHHIQAKLMGRTTCERCNNSVAYIDTENLVFHVMFGGYSVWQLFAMYETGENENKAVMQYNTTHPTLSGNSKRAWIDYQISRSQKDFGVSVGDNDKLLVLITCGDDHDDSEAQARLYMFLKALY